MPIHRMPDAEYADLLRLVLQEAYGLDVSGHLNQYAPSRIHWIREWSMVLGYVEITGLMFDPHSPSGFSLPQPVLSERGRAKLAEINRAHTAIPHHIWLPDAGGTQL
jgi:hypothetical protein